MAEVRADLIDVSCIDITPIAVCPACGELANLDYRGIQENEDGEPGFSLWNCRSCGSTVSGRRVLPADIERDLVTGGAQVEASR